jgi:hypothetical protein
MTKKKNAKKDVPAPITKRRQVESKDIHMALMLDGLDGVKALYKQQTTNSKGEAVSVLSKSVARKAEETLHPKMDEDLQGEYRAFVLETFGEKGSRGRTAPSTGEHRDYTINNRDKDPFVRVPLSSLADSLGEDAKVRVLFEEGEIRVTPVGE